MLLGEEGVLALEADVLTIETASEPGVLDKIAAHFAEADVNIEYTYLAAGPRSGKRPDHSASVRCRKGEPRAGGFIASSIGTEASIRCEANQRKISLFNCLLGDWAIVGLMGESRPSLFLACFLCLARPDILACI